MSIAKIKKIMFEYDHKHLLHITYVYGIITSCLPSQIMFEYDHKHLLHITYVYGIITSCLPSPFFLISILHACYYPL